MYEIYVKKKKVSIFGRKKKEMVNIRSPTFMPTFFVTLSM